MKTSDSRATAKKVSEGKSTSATAVAATAAAARATEKRKQEDEATEDQPVSTSPGWHMNWASTRQQRQQPEQGDRKTARWQVKQASSSSSSPSTNFIATQVLKQNFRAAGNFLLVNNSLFLFLSLCLCVCVQTCLEAETKATRRTSVVCARVDKHYQIRGATARRTSCVPSMFCVTSRLNLLVCESSS